MSAGKLDLFYFGDIGKEDVLNPARVCAQEHAAEILFLVASYPPYQLSHAGIVQLLEVDEATLWPVIGSLLRIGAIESTNDAYRICFPVFLDSDVQRMRGIASDACDSIAEALDQLKGQLVSVARRFRCCGQFGVGRILYHVICDSVFDDMAFAHFDKDHLLCTSKPQPGDRDYLIIGYEACEEVAQNSNLLLCSSNNYTCDGVRFNSFGDSDGCRRDMYRFARLVAAAPRELARFLDGAVDVETLSSLDMKSIASDCSHLVRSVVSRDVYWTDLKNDAAALLLAQLGYISGRQESNHISMVTPVFYPDEQSLITAIGEIVLPHIDNAVRQACDALALHTDDFTAARHMVDMREIGNELWHQIFGFVNERLVRTGYVDQPPHIAGQGRFFRSIRLMS